MSSTLGGDDEAHEVTVQIHVRASAKEFSRYKELVDSDWNRTTLDAVLHLLWDVINESALKSKSEEWLYFLEKTGQRSTQERCRMKSSSEFGCSPSFSMSHSFRKSQMK